MMGTRAPNTLLLKRGDKVVTEILAFWCQVPLRAACEGAVTAWLHVADGHEIVLRA
jgi:hypothetical protein